MREIAVLASSLVLRDEGCCDLYAKRSRAEVAILCWRHETYHGLGVEWAIRMYLSSSTLDDLLKRVLEKLLRSKSVVRASRGSTTELTGVLLRLANPRARLSHTERKGKVFSAIGELLWYLSGSNDLRFITYYIDRYRDDSEDDRTVYGAYGPRLFRMRGRHNQVQNVVSLLRKKATSRRAVIQIFNAEDIAKDYKEVPCTCTLQFLVRRGKLDLLVNMRSNDAFLGLPHDVFAFTMLQEILARTLQLELGHYKHFVGSLHLYDWQVASARQYVDEGWQATLSAAMPPMPRGDPWHSIRLLLKAEAAIRRGRGTDLSRMGLDPYWSDLARLLQVYRYSKDQPSGNASDVKKKIAAIKKAMHHPVYNDYIARRQARLGDVPPSGQFEFAFTRARDGITE